MKALRAVKCRIYPDEAQRELFVKTFGCCRKVWNLMLADKMAAYERDKSRLRTTPAMYKEEYPYLREVDSMALCNTQLDLERAFRAFRARPKVGFPRWKSRKRPRQSYTTNNIGGNVRVARGAIRLPKAGDVKAKVHRRIPPSWRLKSATVSLNAAGRWFCSLLYEFDAPEPGPRDPAQAPSVGLDYSSPSLCVSSADGPLDPPHPYRKAQERLALEQRRLSHMQPGSANHARQRQRIGRIHQRIADVRRDWLHKESGAIAKRFGTVGVEDLDMRGLSGSLRLGKATADNGWGEFRSMLGYKLAERGGSLVVVDRWYPSSKTCSRCGHVQDMPLSERVYRCPECGAVMDRDANAAENIRREALRTLGAARP